MDYKNANQSKVQKNIALYLQFLEYSVLNTKFAVCHSVAFFWSSRGRISMEFSKGQMRMQAL